MTENLIRGRVDALVAAIKSDDEQAGLEHGKALVTGIIIDLNRIANALERLAGPPQASTSRANPFG